MTLGETLHLSSAGVLVIALAATVAYRQLLGRSGAYGRRRPTAWAAAVTLFLVAMIGPLDWLGERRLMSAHMVQHLILMSALPALLVAAWPGRWSGREITGSLAAAFLVLGVGAIWILHLPVALEPALTRPWLHEAQHLALLAAGLLLALPLTAAGARLGFGAAFYLVAAELSIGALGIWLAWSPELIYAAYAEAPRTWGLSAATDQSLAGAVLLVIEEPVLAVEFASVFLAALGSSGGDA